MTQTISDTFVTASGPTNGAKVTGYLASRFSTPPGVNSPPPGSYGADTITVTTGTEFGGPGQFRLPMTSGADRTPTNEPFYVSFDYNGQVSWRYYSNVNAEDGGRGSIGIYGTLNGHGYQAKNFQPGTQPSDLATVSQIVPGPQGTAGVDGPTGPQGVQGAQGNQGFQGPTDVVTSSSAPSNTNVLWLDTSATGNGTQGPQGQQGYQGLQGIAGPQGTAGSNGSQGATGAQGSQGNQGAQGSQGASGANNTAWFVTATSVALSTSVDTTSLSTSVSGFTRYLILATAVGQSSAAGTGNRMRIQIATNGTGQNYFGIDPPGVNYQFQQHSEYVWTAPSTGTYTVAAWISAASSNVTMGFGTLTIIGLS